MSEELEAVESVAEAVVAATTAQEHSPAAPEKEAGPPSGVPQRARDSREWERVGGLCEAHLGEVLAFFCDDCTRAACPVCGMTEHHGHAKRYVGSEGVEDGLFGHTGIFFPSEFTIEGLLKGLNEDLQPIHLRDPSAAEKIKECVKRHRVALERQKRVLTEHVNAVKKAKLKYLQEQQKHLQRTLEDLNGSVTYAKRFLDSDDHFGLLSAEKEITRRLAELNEKCSKITLPTERDWNLDKIKVIRDGKYVKANRGKKPNPPPKPGMRTVHDASFKASAARVDFSVDPDTFEAFVRTCCQEMGDRYWLRMR